MIPVSSTLALVVTGRIALALLPPGHTGAHALGALPLTAAVSFVVGLAVLTAQAAALAACGSPVNGWTLVAPWAAVSAIQLALAPGALVPRHAPVRERASGIALALSVGAGIAAPLAVLVAGGAFDARTGFVLEFLEADGPLVRLASALGLARAHDELLWLRAASAAASVCVLAHGLAISAPRASANVRALVLAAFAAVFVVGRDVFAEDDAVHALLAATAGVVFGVEWLRNAERRALALAVLAWALFPAFAGPLAGPGAAGVAALALVCALTARPARTRAAVWCVAGAACAVWLAA